MEKSIRTNRSEQQAVTYRIEDDKLLREYTQHLDNISSTKATQTILIDRVNNINLRYLDRNNGNGQKTGRLTLLKASLQFRIHQSKQNK